MFSYSQGKCLCWDATYVDSLSATAVIQSGSAAHLAEQQKWERYRDLSEVYIFEPLAVETMGVIGPSSRMFLAELSRQINPNTYECHELQWLIQSRYGKVGSWLTQTFSGVLDITSSEFNFAFYLILLIWLSTLLMSV